MDEKQLNFVDFIEKVKDMDFNDIIDYGNSELARMESMSYSNNGDENDSNAGKYRIF